MRGFATPSGMWLPGARKRDGGSYFDDELNLAEKVILEASEDLVKHINERPDHIVYVASAEERDKMRTVFNHWKATGRIGENPNIRIEYALTDGSIRVGE